MRNSLYSITLEDAVSHIGGHHRYQLRLFLTNLLAWTGWGTAIAIYALHRNFKQNPFNETFNEATCELLLWAGLLVGASVSAYISGRVGRKPVSALNQMLAAISLLLTCLCTIHGAFLVASACSGVFIGGALTGSYLLLVEVVDSVYRPIFIGGLLGAASAGVALAEGLLWLVNWQVAFAILGVIGLVPVWFLSRFYESPRFLAACVGKYSQARHITNFIAIQNRRLGFSETLEGEKVIGYQESRGVTNSPKHNRKYSFIPVSTDIVTVSYAELESIKKYSALELCGTKAVRKLLSNLGAATLFISTSFHTMTPVLSSRLTVYGIVLVDVITCVCTGFLLKYMNRQVWLTVMSLGGTVCLIIELVFSSSATYIQSEGLAALLSVLLAVLLRVPLVASVTALFLLATEAFATNIRSQGLATMELCSRFGFFTGWLLWELAQAFELSSAMMALPLLMLSSNCVCNLPEAVGYVMEDYLEEDKSSMNQPLEISNLQAEAGQNQT